MIDNINTNELLDKILKKDKLTNVQTLNYPRFLSEFIKKTIKDLDLIDSSISILEKDKQNTEAMDNILNIFCDITASSGFVSQNIIQQTAYQTKILIKDCKSGSIVTNENIICLILASGDYIKQICNDTALNNDENFLNTVFTLEKYR